MMEFVFSIYLLALIDKYYQIIYGDNELKKVNRKIVGYL